MEKCKLCPNPRESGNKNAFCKDCRLIKNREAGDRWRKGMSVEEKENYLARVRKSQLKARLGKLGLTLADYDIQLLRQSYCCAICLGKDPGGKGGWHVDHDHATGKFRGLLCHYCNIALGCFKDSIQNLQRATQYLRTD